LLISVNANRSEIYDVSKTFSTNNTLAKQGVRHALPNRFSLIQQWKILNFTAAE